MSSSSTRCQKRSNLSREDSALGTRSVREPTSRPAATAASGADTCSASESGALPIATVRDTSTSTTKFLDGAQPEPRGGREGRCEQQSPERLAGEQRGDAAHREGRFVRAVPAPGDAGQHHEQHHADAVVEQRFPRHERLDPFGDPRLTQDREDRHGIGGGDQRAEQQARHQRRVQAEGVQQSVRQAAHQEGRDDRGQHREDQHGGAQLPQRVRVERECPGEQQEAQHALEDEAGEVHVTDELHRLAGERHAQRDESERDGAREQAHDGHADRGRQPQHPRVEPGHRGRDDHEQGDQVEELHGDIVSSPWSGGAPTRASPFRRRARPPRRGRGLARPASPRAAGRRPSRRGRRAAPGPHVRRFRR